MSFLPLQLPIKVGHQNTHTKVSTEHNKECLINISKYKFSLVISGLTTILKNVNNMVSAAPPVRAGDPPLYLGKSDTFSREIPKVSRSETHVTAALFSPNRSSSLHLTLWSHHDSEAKKRRVSFTT